MLKHKISIFFLLVSQIIVAQNVKKCNTMDLVYQSITEDSRNLTSMNKIAAKNYKWISEHTNESKSVITIPVVIHVVHKNTHANIGSGTNISDAQIEDALRILNEDFSKTNPEFPNPPRNTFTNLAADVQIQFCLASSDENGNPTNGVTRTSTTKADFDPDTEANDMKRNLTGGKDGWDPEKYLNIWVCNLAISSSGSFTIGYAYLPGSVTWSMWKDGLVVDFQYFGTIGASTAGNDGSTPTHEIGHYLGLMHTFCDDTDANGNPICCDNDDNNWGGYVDDTPASKDIYWGSVNSSTNNNTCNDVSYPNNFNTNVLDMDENFMSYSADVWMFTQEQADVMIGTMNGYRSSLKNSPAAVNCTGTVGINNLLDNNQIRIYPNPTKGKILIQNLMQISNNSIIIRNILGEIILTSDSRNNLVSLDLYHLENGIYFIEISTNNGVRIEKVILAK